MATFLERIQVLIDIDSSKGAAALKATHADIDAAETKFEKLKAAGGGVFDVLKANAPLAMAGVGTAIGAFAVKAVSDFQSLALEVNNFVQKTGTSANAASRWVEVSKDLGVSTDAVATAFGRMERAQDAGKLAKYGLTATDASGRFAELLGKIGAIPDENERAAAAFSVFGKSWQSIAPLLDSTEELNKRLAEVPQNKLISDSQISDARTFRDNLDDVRDAIEGVSNWIGGQLVGAINSLVASAKELGGQLAGPFEGLKTAAETATGPVGGLGAAVGIAGTVFNEAFNPVTQFGHAMDAVGAVTDGVTTGFGLWGDSSDEASGKLVTLGGTIRSAQVDEKEFAAQTAAAAEAAKEQQDATDKLNASLAIEADAVKKAYDANFALKDAQDKLSTSLVALNQKTQDATASDGDKARALRDSERASEDVAVALAEQTTAQQTANGETVDAAGKQANFRDALLSVARTLDANSPLRANIVGLANDINNRLPASKQIDINANVSQANEDLQTIINRLQNIRDKTVTVTVDQHVHVPGAGQAAGGWTKAAGGGNQGGSVLVGELGPEVVDLPNGSFVNPNSQTARRLAGGGGGDIYNVTFNVMQKLTPDEAVNLIEQWKRRNAKRPWMAA